MSTVRVRDRVIVTVSASVIVSVSVGISASARVRGWRSALLCVLTCGTFAYFLNILLLVVTFRSV